MYPWQKKKKKTMHENLFYNTNLSLFSSYIKVQSGTNEKKKSFFIFSAFIFGKHPSIFLYKSFVKRTFTLKLKTGNSPLIYPLT